MVEVDTGRVTGLGGPNPMGLVQPKADLEPTRPTVLDWLARLAQLAGRIPMTWIGLGTI